MPEIAINVENVTKIYRLYSSPLDRLKEALHPFRRQYHHNYFALKNVSFEIKKGDAVGIIGRNGSGKSTLLKILSGVLSPSSGRVHLNGKISALLELGAGFNPELTGIDNVYFNGMVMGYSRHEMNERLDSILAFADIGQFVYQPVKTYSSGMFVRLAFALAVNVEPEILIIDEALSVGDIMFQSKCMEKISAMSSNGVTTIFVTHDMNPVNTLCNYAIMLDSGEIYNQGRPQVITLQYYQLIREREHAKQLTSTREDADKLYQEQRKFVRDKQECTDYRYGTGAAKILDYRLITSHSDDACAIECGEKFILRIKVMFDETVSNPCFGFAFNNVAGQYLQSAHSYFDSVESFGPQQKGSIVAIEMESIMLLNPGDYLLSIGIVDHRSREDFTNLDARKNVSTVKVYGQGVSTGVVYHKPIIRQIMNYY